MKTTAFHELHSAIRDGIISADDHTVYFAAVTIMTIPVKMVTNDMNAAVYFAVIDAESSADITNTRPLYVLPSYDIDLSFSTICDEDSFAAVTLKMISYQSDTNNDDNSANSEATFHAT